MIAMGDQSARGLRRFLPAWWREALDPATADLRAFVTSAAEEVPPGALMLDAGAGEGQYRLLFAHTRRVAADFAKGDATWDYSGLDVICDLHRIPFRDAAFDAALCTQVLEHLPEPWTALEELARCMKPDAVLILSVPLTGEEHQRPYDFYRYTSFGIRHLLERAGFSVDRMQRLGGQFRIAALIVPRLNEMAWSRPLRIALFPLYALSKLMLGAVAPLILYHLDRRDAAKDMALNLGVVARRRSRQRAS